MSKQTRDQDAVRYTRLHLRFGWWALLCFMTLGLVLETMHGFKVQWYLNVSNATRRLMWTLAHTHGTLLALANLAFALSIHHMPKWNMLGRRIASTCLLAGSILMPAGFFVGGIVIYDGDPGLGILLVPIGAAILLTAVFLTALGTRTMREGSASRD